MYTYARVDYLETKKTGGVAILDFKRDSRAKIDRGTGQSEIVAQAVRVRKPTAIGGLFSSIFKSTMHVQHVSLASVLQRWDEDHE